MADAKRVLITGSTGFVGANLTMELLRQGHEVHSILRQTSNQWRIADILSEMNIHWLDLSSAQAVQAAVQEIRPQVVFHLATYGGYPVQQDEQKIIETNIAGTANLLAAAKKAKPDCFVNAGTSSEYGIKEKAMNETDLLQPLSFYGASKAFSTLLCSVAWLADGMPTVTLRLFSPYGYFEEPTRLVPYVTQCFLKGEQPSLASPKSVRDFVFIEDVVEAFLLASKTENAFGEIINIAGGKQQTVGKVVELLHELCNAKTEPRWQAAKPRANEPKKWVADIAKAKKLLGWKPKHALQQGLQKTVEWQRKRII